MTKRIMADVYADLQALEIMAHTLDQAYYLERSAELVKEHNEIRAAFKP